MRDGESSRSILPMAVLAVVGVAVAAAIAFAVMHPSTSNQPGTTTQVATDGTASKDAKDADATNATGQKDGNASTTPEGTTTTDGKDAADAKNENKTGQEDLLLGW